MSELSFPQIIQAEKFPQRILWTTRDSFALSLIPIIFILGYLGNLNFSAYTVALLDVFIRGLMFIAICVIYQDMLKQHWQKFKQAPVKGMILVISGMVLLQTIITLTRMALPTSTGGEAADTTLFDNASIAFLFIAGFSPFFTALIEDIVFRYTLLQKLFTPNILWRIIVIVVNSIIFGLIHYHNFDGHVLATVSFMTAGLFLNLIYLWTRNIWPVLLIHIFNNAILAWLPLLFLAYVGPQ